QSIPTNRISTSIQIGISKPNPRIYQRVCSDLNLRPPETMYVGDNPLHDVDPPNQIGLVTGRMRRGAKHYPVGGKTAPRLEVQNFWDLLDYVRQEFAIQV